MSIKKRLFGPVWEHRDPEIRLQAVIDSDEPELIEQLGKLAEHDSSPAVRLAALRRIDTEPFWLDAQLRETDPAIIAAADAFLARAVLRSANEAFITERLDWFGRIDDRELIRSAACKAPDRALRAAALERIDTPGFLGDRVVDERDDELALSLLERIDQESTLLRIAEKLRRHSKKRARAVAARLKLVQAASGRHDPKAEHAAELVGRAERLARGLFEGDRSSELADLESGWASIDQPDEVLERRFAGAVAIVRRAMTAPSASLPAETADQSALAEQPGAVDPVLTAFEQRLENAAPIERLKPDAAAEILADFDRSWSRIDTPGPADEALRQRLLPSIHLLQKRRLHVESPPPAKRREDDFDWSAALDAAAERLDSGPIADAQVQLRELRSRFDRLKPRLRPRRVGGRLSRLEGRLREMRNWEHWSNNKVRSELIERVEKLAGSGQHPDAISAELKQARAQWEGLEKLEVLPGDRRQHAAPPSQWRRFQAACKQAFDQAQPFFEKRHEVRSGNLDQLDAFLARGNELATDEASDVESLTTFMRRSRQVIQRLDELPPKARGKAAGELRQLMDRLSARLDQGFEEIENRKRGLIREAQALVHESDLKSAIDQAKSLQARWQKAGRGRRRIEQPLWKEFRAPIDSLFETLAGEHAEQVQAREAEQAELRALVEQAEALAKVDDEQLSASEGRLQTVKQEWQSIQRKPKALESRFEAAEQSLKRRLEERRHAERRLIRDQLDTLSDTVQQAWQARLDGQDVKLPDPLPSFADDAAIAPLLLEQLKVLAEPATHLNDLDETAKVNGEQARQVVIEMEFLAGLESPEADRQARMNFQVERLANRLGGRDQQASLSGELDQLRQRWYATFPRPAEQHAALVERFRKCGNILESMSGAE